jgi:hypothetical protein
VIKDGVVGVADGDGIFLAVGVATGAAPADADVAYDKVFSAVDLEDAVLDEDAAARRRLTGDREIAALSANEPQSVIAKVNHAADGKDDGARAGAGLFNSIAQRAGARGVEVGDDVNVATAPPGGQGAKSFGAVKGLEVQQPAIFEGLNAKLPPSLVVRSSDGLIGR